MVELGRSDDVRKRNRRRILSVLRHQVSASSKGICARTGLSASTVSAITSELLDEAVITRVDDDAQTNPGRGRPQVRLALNPDAALVASIVLQVDAISVSLTDYAGARIAERDLPFPARSADPGEFTDTMISILGAAMEESARPISALRRIRVGVQGVTDVDGGYMLWSPITSHRELPFQQILEDAFGADTRVSNDCRMIARALHWREPEHFNRDYAAVLLSHGIGMGLMLNGDLVSGIRSSGTEFGHLSHIPQGALCRCGRHGCIEAYAGDYAIYRRAIATSADTAPRNDISDKQMDVVYAAAMNGDTNALEAYREAGRALGTGLSDMFALVDPIPIAFVGKGTKAFEFIEPSLRDALAETKLDIGAQDADIRCYPDERPLIDEGCTITALLEVDELLSRSVPVDHKVTSDAV
ncbi:MAG: ROK family transcriptional regulator [Alphaproteobacteria bacterium]|nr:ROK family transcriptional regulator [Alphaproteobacteria bacterium]